MGPDTRDAPARLTAPPPGRIAQFRARLARWTGRDWPPVGAGKGAGNGAGGDHAPIPALWAALRPRHWAKNLILFAPLIAGQSTAPAAWGAAVIALFAFCAAASAGYLVNDLLDLAADRAHPRKRERPLAAGRLSVGVASAAAVVLALCALGSAALVGPGVALCVAAYLCATWLYSLTLKRMLAVDLLALCGFFALRLLAGALAGGVVLSGLFLGFAGLVFLSLAAAKRLAELPAPGQAAVTTGRRYGARHRGALIRLGGAAAAAAVAVLIVHVVTAGDVYARPGLLWVVAGAVALWLGRAQARAAQGLGGEDVIATCLADRVCQGAAVLGTVAWIGAVW